MFDELILLCILIIYPLNSTVILLTNTKGKKVDVFSKLSKV